MLSLMDNKFKVQVSKYSWQLYNRCTICTVLYLHLHGSRYNKTSLCQIKNFQFFHNSWKLLLLLITVLLCWRGKIFALFENTYLDYNFYRVVGIHHPFCFSAFPAIFCLISGIGILARLHKVLSTGVALKQTVISLSIYYHISALCMYISCDCVKDIIVDNFYLVCTAF